MEKPYIGASDGLSPDYGKHPENTLNDSSSTVKFTLSVSLINGNVTRPMRMAIPEHTLLTPANKLK